MYSANNRMEHCHGIPFSDSVQNILDNFIFMIFEDGVQNAFYLKWRTQIMLQMFNGSVCDYDLYSISWNVILKISPENTGSSHASALFDISSSEFGQFSIFLSNFQKIGHFSLNCCSVEHVRHLTLTISAQFRCHSKLFSNSITVEFPA